MSFSLGIVGLPNAGKSTLFKALTSQHVLIAPYPFATIDPNVGVVSVPDERLKVLAQISASEKIIPTTIRFVDIAGLVSGAHKGEGLGNKFLGHIREADAIVHVVRAFSDPHLSGKETDANPNDAREEVLTELTLADLAVAEKRHEDAVRALRSNSATPAEILEETALLKVKTALEAGKAARTVQLTEDERIAIAPLNLLTAKPLLTVFNCQEGKEHAPEMAALIESVAPTHAIALSAKIEAELAELSASDAVAMRQDLGLKTTGLERFVRASYSLLHLVTFFTTGPQETKAWTVRTGSRAPQAAGVIHSDFERGFIRAEAISYNDFVAAGGEAGARQNGTLRLEGKDYIVKDGDVMHFRFAV